MTKILLDTDIILDFFFGREPYSEDAAKILSLCESNRIEAYITPNLKTLKMPCRIILPNRTKQG
jgi:predicted nucleic acid-binding protein